MKKIIPIILALIVAAAPAGAQFKRAGKQAKEDAKLVVSQLKAEGYKPIDKIKLDDAVRDYLEVKYSEKDVMEVIGKGSSKTLNEAKALAREDAISYYPLGEVVNSFFVYKKNKRRYDVVCYTLLKASSRAASSIRRNEGTATTIANARAEQDAREARAEAKKMEQQAQKDMKQAQKKAEKQAEKVRKKADKAHQKAVDKANEKARKAIEKADEERAKALEGIGSY